MDQEEKILHEADNQLIMLTKKINLYTYLMPTNLVAERDKFLAMKGNYDPQFTYAFPAEQEMQGRMDALDVLKQKYFADQRYTHFIAKLLEEKIEENILKVQLLIAYSKQDVPNIKKYNTLLFGDLDPELIKKSEAVVQSYREPKPETRGRMLSGKEIQEYILKYMYDNNIKDVELAPVKQSPAKFVLLMGKDRCRLVFSQHLELREHNLMGDLIHELGVHYARYLSGKKSGREILKHGTAGYMTDEEGLAIRSVCQYKKTIFPKFQKINIYQKYLLLATGEGKSFSEMTENAVKNARAKNLTHAFAMTARIRQGIQDTSQPVSGSLFLHNKIYAEGYEHITKTISGDTIGTFLFHGKIRNEDLPKIIG